MSTIQIDELTIRLPSDTHNTFNPTFAFGGRSNANNNSCLVVGLRDTQNGELLLPIDADGNVVVIPGRRYQVVNVVVEGAMRQREGGHRERKDQQQQQQRQQQQQHKLDRKKEDSRGEERGSLQVVPVPVVADAAAPSETTPATVATQPPHKGKRDKSQKTSPAVKPSPSPPEQPKQQHHHHHQQQQGLEEEARVAADRDGSEDTKGGQAREKKAKRPRRATSEAEPVSDAAPDDEPSLFQLAVASGAMAAHPAPVPKKERKEQQRHQQRTRDSEAAPEGRAAASTPPPAAPAADETFLSRFALMATPTSSQLPAAGQGGTSAGEAAPPKKAQESSKKSRQHTAADVDVPQTDGPDSSRQPLQEGQHRKKKSAVAETVLGEGSARNSPVRAPVTLPPSPRESSHKRRRPPHVSSSSDSD